MSYREKKAFLSTELDEMPSISTSEILVSISLRRSQQLGLKLKGGLELTHTENQ